MDDEKRVYDHGNGKITCKICGKEIQGTRGMNHHMYWHIKNGDAVIEERERTVTDSIAVFPNGLEYKF